ncbi:hypothetical protein Agub_g14545, partial [Astrephomene gubernaculifera]
LRQPSKYKQLAYNQRSQKSEMLLTATAESFAKGQNNASNGSHGNEAEAAGSPFKGSAFSNLGMRLRAMRPEEHDALLKADQGVYATSSPVTLQTLRDWCSQVPEMAFIVEDASGEPLGNCVLIPCSSSGFEALTTGRLLECDMYGNERLYKVPERDNNAEADAVESSIGVYMYHMEKSRSYPRGFPAFGVVALYGIAHALRLLQKLRQARGCSTTPLSVRGLAGLAVSPSGIHLMTVLYGCREQPSYICPEHVMRAPPTGTGTASTPAAATSSS